MVVPVSLCFNKLCKKKVIMLCSNKVYLKTAALLAWGKEAGNFIGVRCGEIIRIW
jgi:hypothetical protein